MTIFEQAEKKYLNRKTKEIDYKNKTFREFLVECYLDIDPSSYGKYIQTMLEFLCEKEKIYLTRIQEKEDCGDVRLKYPLNEDSFYYKYDNGLYYEIDYCFESVKSVKMDWEFKVSYLGKSDGYTIRNIRPYQEINGGYIICLVDCDNKFQEEFYVVDFKFLSDNFNLSHMNGTKYQHDGSGFQNLGTAFKKNSNHHLLLKEHSKLEGTSLNDLFSYLKKVYLGIYDEFINSSDCKKIVEEEKKGSDCYGVFYPHKNIFPSVENFFKYREIVLDELKCKYDRIIDIKVSPNNQYLIEFTIKGRIDSYDYYINIENEYKKRMSENPIVRAKKTIYHFEVFGKKYDSDIFTENYVQFLRDVSNIHNYEFFKNIIPSYFISDTYDNLNEISKSKNQVHSINDKFFISSYSSTPKKIGHIKNICLGMGLNMIELSKPPAS